MATADECRWRWRRGCTSRTYWESTLRPRITFTTHPFRKYLEATYSLTLAFVVLTLRALEVKIWKHQELRGMRRKHRETKRNNNHARSIKKRDKEQLFISLEKGLGERERDDVFEYWLTSSWTRLPPGSLNRKRKQTEDPKPQSRRRRYTTRRIFTTTEAQMCPDTVLEI